MTRIDWGDRDKCELCAKVTLTRRFCPVCFKRFCPACWNAKKEDASDSYCSPACEREMQPIKGKPTPGHGE